MTRLKRFLLALLVLVIPVSEIASGAEWSVWDGFAPSESGVAYSPSPPPVKGLNLPLLVPLGRRWLPDLAEREGRLRYIGEMHWAAEVCLARGDLSFTEADLDELDRLWKANAEALSPEDIWPVRYGVMHHRQNGGTATSNASCAVAKAWLLQDRASLTPAAGSSAP